LFNGRALTVRETEAMNAPTNTKAQLLANTVEHIDITSFDARPIIDSMRKMSFSSRDTARAADIFNMALEDTACSPWRIPTWTRWTGC
jgi:deoxyhypusine synthase